jgi:hypothetical protein
MLNDQIFSDDLFNVIRYFLLFTFFSFLLTQNIYFLYFPLFFTGVERVVKAQDLKTRGYRFESQHHRIINGIVLKKKHVASKYLRILKHFFVNMSLS